MTTKSNKNNVDRTEYFSVPVDLPKFKPMRAKDWIPYGRSTNEFSRELNELITGNSEYGGCEMHASIIETKSLMITGSDVELTTPEAERLFGSPRKANNLIFKLAKDISVYGWFCVEVIRSRSGAVVKINHIDCSQVLWSPKDERGEIPGFWWSDDWSNYRKDAHKPVFVPRYENGSKEARSFMVGTTSYNSGVGYYTYPDYIAALPAIKADIGIVDFHHSNLDNNFEPGKMVTFIGDEPDEEGKARIREKFENKHSGTKKTGRTIINYCIEKESAPTIETLGDDGLDKKFDTLSVNITQRILTGHGVTSPLLVGVAVPGKLGGSAELETARELFFEYRILPKRNVIIDALEEIVDGIRIIDGKKTGNRDGDD